MTPNKQINSETGRITTCFDSDWKFAIGDFEGTERTAYDDGNWRNLRLPHDWSVEGTFDSNHAAGGDGAYLPAGIGWYRKHFRIPEAWKGKKVTIQFDGVYMNSEVWINGNYLGKRPNGYASFQYDLTPYLLFNDDENIISVKVDNSEQPNSRWYSGSGIYRHTWLICTNPVHIGHWGVFVNTPEVSTELAKVKIKALLENEYEHKVQAILQSTVVDGNGNAVASQQKSVLIEGGRPYECNLELQVRKPQLWSDSSPNLYTLVIKVYLDGLPVDELHTPFGIRIIRFDADRGFFLNDKPVKLNGVCLHHDGGCVGAAVPEGVWVRRLQLLKNMGCNAIRMSHNIPAPELLDLCDQMGFLVMDEAFDEWTLSKSKSDNRTYGYYSYFNEWHERDLIGMLHRDRNHPSIIMWSIGNEIPEQSQPYGHELARKLADICYREDPTRPVTAACDNIAADVNAATDSFVEVLDVVGYNYVNRWRNRTETFYGDDRNLYPKRKFIGSENTSIRGPRGEYVLDQATSVVSKQDDHGQSPWRNAPYYSRMIRTELLWKFTKMHDYVAGDFMWTGIDYLGEARWPHKNSSAGVIDMCGFPKDGYYFYQSQWTDEPMIHAFPHWNWQGQEGRIIPVLCYTNCDSVELFLNGKSFGSKSYELPIQGMTERYGHYDKPFVHISTSDLHLSWDVPYEPGTLKFVGSKNGQAVCIHETVTAGVPAKVKLHVDKETMNADGNDVCHVTVYILDSDGRIVPTADNLVTFEVEGQGELIGVDNGQPDSHEPFKGIYRKAYNGLCLAIIRSIESKGSVRLKAESVGLASSEVSVQIN